MADEDKSMSQKAADEIARLTKIQAQWKKFESPEEVKKRRVRQAQILGEAMLKLQASVSAQWHAYMLEVAKESENEESEGEESEGEKWLVKREQLMDDGWRFEKDSNDKEWLYLPQQTE